MYNNIALQKGKYKLVGNTDYNSPANAFELYDLERDPYEQVNIVKDYTDRAEEMKKEMDIIFSELAVSGNLAERPRIEIGTSHENPVILNRNDADGQRGIWEQEEIFGFWRVKINEGKYNLTEKKRGHLNRHPQKEELTKIDTSTNLYSLIFTYLDFIFSMRLGHVFLFITDDINQVIPVQVINQV